MLVTQALGPLLMAGSSGDDALGDSNPATLLSALLVYQHAESAQSMNEEVIDEGVAT